MKKNSRADGLIKYFEKSKVSLANETDLFPKETYT